MRAGIRVQLVHGGTCPRIERIERIDRMTSNIQIESNGPH
jgi:hypothetical protein